MDIRTDQKIEVSGPKRTRPFLEIVATIREGAKSVFAPNRTGRFDDCPGATGSCGFGGGQSPIKPGKSSGTGGGGGIYIMPVGCIEIHNDKACFRPSVAPVSLFCTGVLLAIFLLVRASRLRQRQVPNTNEAAVHDTPRRRLLGRKS